MRNKYKITQSFSTKVTTCLLLSLLIGILSKKYFISKSLKVSQSTRAKAR